MNRLVANPYGLRFFVILALAWVILPGISRSAAENLSEEQKWTFVQAVCDGLEREARCLSFGKAYLNTDLDFMVFEACSFSGERKTIMTCFDRAARMATELTGDPEYAKRMAFCHRFEESDSADVTDAVVRCYREGFKYSQEFIEEKYSGQHRQ